VRKADKQLTIIPFIICSTTWFYLACPLETLEIQVKTIFNIFSANLDSYNLTSKAKLNGI